MHDSSHEKMDAFVRVHLAAHREDPLEIVDFGSQVVDDQGLSYRGLFDAPAWTYRGLDIEAGHNVDITVSDPYHWTEVDSNAVDLVISGQAFEHVEFFWASIFEIVRVLRPGGLAVIIAPSGGFEHRYPVDCWRFYRDGFVALTKYVGCELVDAFTDWGNLDWEDSILVVRKPQWDAAGEQRFRQRAMLQRALVDEEPVKGPVDVAALEVEASVEASKPAPSVLADVSGGALTAELTASREQRLAAEAHAAAAAADAAEAQARELAELRAHVEALRTAPGPAMRWYGSARRRAANIAGSRGRQIYKRLRGRAT